MQLIKTAVLDAWAKRAASAREERERPERQTATIRSKLGRIADLVTDGTLDARAYQRQRDSLHGPDPPLKMSALPNRLIEPSPSGGTQATMRYGQRRHKRRREAARLLASFLMVGDSRQPG